MCACFGERELERESEREKVCVCWRERERERRKQRKESKNIFLEEQEELFYHKEFATVRNTAASFGLGLSSNPGLKGV